MANEQEELENALEKVAEEAALEGLDNVGAGLDEVVMYATGSSARQTERTRDKPCDAVIMAIVDTWEIDGETVYEK